MESEGRTAEQELEEVQRDIEQWRRTRLKSGPMPEELWARAVTIGRVVGLYSAVQALNVNYSALKRRMSGGGLERLKKRGRPPKLRGGNFFEVTGLPLKRPFMEGALVEVTAPDGSRLTIRSNSSGVDVAALVTAFREQR